MIAMRIPSASLPANPAIVATPMTAGSRACYRIILQCVGTSAKGPIFDTFNVGTDGKSAKRLVTRSRTPALDTARVFAELGIDGCLEFWRVGSTTPCMFLDIETAARLTVIDSDQQGPRFAPWKPFDPAHTQRAGIAIAAHPSEQGAASA